MKRLIQTLLAVSALQCLPLPAQAVDVETEARQLLEAGAVGFSMALIDKGGIYWSESHGFADIEAKRPMSIDSNHECRVDQQDPDRNIVDDTGRAREA